MIPNSIMKAVNYTGQNINGWYIGEKLDGVRGRWDGDKILTRAGNEVFAPRWFLDQLPAGVPLDGELHVGRGQFQQVLSYVRKDTPIDAEWAQVSFNVFDLLGPGGIESRFRFAADSIDGSEVARMIEHQVCLDEGEMHRIFDEIVSEGGEGVVLRKPGSLYKGGKSNDILRYKERIFDEAVVEGYLAGGGKYEGMVGALLCRWNGMLIRVGTGLTDADRNHPPEKGSPVTFAYKGLTQGGVPRESAYIVNRNYE